MQFQWRLMTHTDPEKSTNIPTFIAVNEYLKLYGQDNHIWIPDLEMCGIWLECQGKEWLISQELGFGRIDVLILQFEAAYQRLIKGQRALIRSRDLDIVDPPFLLLEILNEVETSISLIFIDDLRLRMEALPKEELYAYINENRKKVFEFSHNLNLSSDVRNLSYPTSRLLTSLKQEAEFGRELYALFGMPDGSCWL